MMAYEFIRNRRKQLGLTQQKLANRAGFSISVVKRFEANRPYQPSGESALRMIAALEVDSNEFIKLTFPE